MEARAAEIALAEDEAAAGLLLDVGDAVEHLEEEVHERDRMRGRADAVVDPGQVGHVRVVLFVEVDAVPAGLELDLGPQPVGAVRVGHQRGFRLRGVVQAGEADAVGDRSVGFVGCRRGLVGAEGFVARDHAEAWGEGHDGAFVVATPEVVDCHAAVGHFQEGGVGVLVVERGCPVGRFVGLDLARGAVGG